MLFFFSLQVETRERIGVNSAEPGPGRRADRSCGDRMCERNLFPGAEVSEALVSCSVRRTGGQEEG